VSDQPLRRTALFDVHRALGARIVPFGGYEMPVQYAGILAEHDATRFASTPACSTSRTWRSSSCAVPTWRPGPTS
jgi:hypothetical protein